MTPGVTYGEGRPRGRIPETREEFRSHRDEEEPLASVYPYIYFAGYIFLIASGGD
jgi:hypothetical protein